MIWVPIHNYKNKTKTANSVNHHQMNKIIAFAITYLTTSLCVSCDVRLKTEDCNFHKSGL